MDREFIVYLIILALIMGVLGYFAEMMDSKNVEREFARRSSEISERLRREGILSAERWLVELHRSYGVLDKLE